MSAPRPVRPNTTYLLTRRTTQRQFLLTPCAVVNEVMLYLLAVMAERYTIDVHAFVCMSSHIHLHCTDVKGRLPFFMAQFLSLSARSLNAFHGRFENFWSNERYSRVELPGDVEQLEKLVYVLTNPVSAGLVEKHEDWPGAVTRPLLDGAYEIEVRRPDHFFDEDSETMPASARLRVTPPPMLRGEKPRVLGKRLFDLVKASEKYTRDEMQREGRNFVGRKNVLRQSPRRSAQSREERFKTNPTLASRDKWVRIELLQRNLDWLKEYREAYSRYRRGDRDVIFPFGSFKWPTFAHANVAPAPKIEPG